MGHGKFIWFLSRLCGGEEYFFNRLILTLFLSRLCGGEVNVDGTATFG